MKFGQLAEFRNGIRRSRSVDEITRSELPGRGEFKNYGGICCHAKTYCRNYAVVVA